MKVLIFDSGPIINFSMNGLVYLLENLKKIFDGKFIITEAVKYEVMDRPIKNPRFELEALRIKDLLSAGILELPSALGIDNNLIKKETTRLMNEANGCARTNDRKINIVSEAEISCLALSSELTKKGIDNLIAIDERTTRILTERPENLERLMSDKLKTQVKVSCNLDTFKDFRFIRSTELVYVAFKKGILGIDGSEALEAALYATKYKGSSVSFEEIKVLKKL